MSDYKVLAEKEYYKLSADKPTIGLLMMVKNESLRLKVSLESVKKTVQALIIYDTGSTDDTVKIIQDFSQKYKINLYLIQGEFVNFSTSRNVVLEYAEKVNVHYLLLLDCNDELQGGDKLLLYAKFMLDQPYNGFLTCQRWWSGQHDKYFNQRFIKNRCGWRYFGAVHEWMKDTTVEGPIPAHPVIRMPDDIVLFQLNDSAEIKFSS